MKKILPLLFIIILFSCKNDTNHNIELDNLEINEQTYVELGGEKQYVEILSTSKDNPVMLFVHGGPAWPQTPQLRYFNRDIASKYTLVIWEQRGAGKSYKINPTPDNISLKQIVKDGNELTSWIKKKFSKEKIFLAGYSWGSLVGVLMAQQHPENFEAYIGIAQIINMSEGMRISREWLKEQATIKQDKKVLAKIDSLENHSFYKDGHDLFFQQYLLVHNYKGAVYQKKSLKEVEKAENYYDDYKNYDWYAVWSASSKLLEDEFYSSDVRKIKKLDLPVYLFEGRHDWNIPSVLAVSWMEDLEAPKKEVIWFENSGHGPLEEEPEIFNKEILNILKK